MKKIAKYVVIISLMLTMSIPLAIFAESNSGGVTSPTSSNIASGEDYGLGMSKTITTDESGQDWLNLEVYGKGSETIINKSKPADIVLVLDISGSMEKYKIGEVKRIVALKNAVNTFIGNVANDGSDHRISIVTFNNHAYINSYLVNAHDNEVNLKTMVNNLSAEDGTHPQLGLNKAKNVFDAGGHAEGRQRVVVMFTDGYPGDYINSFNDDYAKSAVGEAYQLKNDYGALVYTIAVIDNANPSSNFNLMDNGDRKKINKLLHYISSNYPKAFTFREDLSFKNRGYYMSANNTRELDEIFELISENIGGSATELDETTQVIDKITPYFTLSHETDSKKVKVYSYNYVGENTWANKEDITESVSLNVNRETKVVTVSGFDYSENWVGKVDNLGHISYRGKKLIVAIPIEREKGFIGGNQVPSNTKESGIYFDNEMLCPFDIPVKDLSIIFDYKCHDTTTHILTPTQVASVLDNPLGFIQSNVNYSIDGVNNAFVDIEYKIDFGNGTIYTYRIPAGQTTGSWNDDFSEITLTQCRQFKVDASIKPTKTGTVLNKTLEQKSGYIHALTPKMNTLDKTIYWGEGDTVDLQELVSLDDTWVDCSGHTEIPAPITNKPEVIFSYVRTDTNQTVTDFTAYDPDKDLKVLVKAKIGDQEINNYLAVGSKKDLMIFVKYCSLSVTKTGCNPEDQSQSFMFNLKGPMGIDMKFAIEGNATQKISGLPVGTYKVTEDTNWSFRYHPISGKEEEILSSKYPNGAILFSNRKDKFNWFSGDCFQRNVMSIVQEVE